MFSGHGSNMGATLVGGAAAAAAAAAAYGVHHLTHGHHPHGHHLGHFGKFKHGKFGKVQAWKIWESHWVWMKTWPSTVEASPSWVLWRKIQEVEVVKLQAIV